MNKYNVIELVLDILSLVIFLGYHFWLFCLQGLHPKGHIRIGKTKWFNVYDMSGTARLLWTHSLAQDEKEAITAVQTVRNAVMACGLFGTACAYIGARALPDLLLNDQYMKNLDSLAKLDPFTGRRHGQTGLLSTGIKGGICFCIIFVTFVLFGQAARFYVHLGYLVKIVASKHNVKHWRVEGEALALMRQAGFSFSLAMRGFFFFGLALLYFPGPTSLFCSSVVMTTLLFFTDHLPVTSYNQVLHKIEERKAHSYDEEGRSFQQLSQNAALEESSKEASKKAGKGSDQKQQHDGAHWHEPHGSDPLDTSLSMDNLSATLSDAPLITGSHHREQQQATRH